MPLTRENRRRNLAKPKIATNPKGFGDCWYYIACSPEKGMVPGVERLPCIGV